MVKGFSYNLPIAIEIGTSGCGNKVNRKEALHRIAGVYISTGILLVQL